MVRDRVEALVRQGARLMPMQALDQDVDAHPGEVAMNAPATTPVTGMGPRHAV